MKLQSSMLVRLTLLLLAAWLGGCSMFASKPALPPDPHPQVLMQTSLGDVKVELDRDKAPVSVDNFLTYVQAGHYDGTIFHRVISGFVAQGGGYDEKFKERPTRAPIIIESANGLSNQRGTIAMAREEGPNTGTSQFYFNLVDNIKLDPHPENPARRYGYTVFGKVTQGLSVIDQMAAQSTSMNATIGAPDVPVTNIVLIKATLLPRIIPPPPGK